MGYRKSAPYFVVMELPRKPTIRHHHYGDCCPEDLGVGCARHWLLLLADALALEFAFMLDDSIREWHGVTLVGDRHCLFGKAPRSKVQLSRVPFGRILEHLADPAFSEGELRKFSVV